MLKRLIFFLLIFSLPFQLGKHFWLAESFVKGFRIDYLSPTLYLTDVFLIGYLIINLKKVRLNYYHLGFLILALINLAVSSFNPITFFAWLRLFVYFIFLTTLLLESDLKSKISLPLKLSLVFVLFLEFAQVILQHSLGGIFYLFGERPLSPNLPSIAKLSFPGFTLLRPYSTFSHPNSLAGYLLVCLLLLPVISKSKLLRLITIAGILVTLSKAAIITLLFPNLYLGLLMSLLPLIAAFIQLPSWLLISFSSRLYLIKYSLRLIGEHLLLGVGLRQFIPALGNLLAPSQLSYFSLQPVHNIFLLILTEIGLLPLAFIVYIGSKLQSLLNQKSLLKLISIVLMTGALDHYWWTLPQNQLILLLAFATIVRHEPSHHHH